MGEGAVEIRGLQWRGIQGCLEGRWREEGARTVAETVAGVAPEAMMSCLARVVAVNDQSARRRVS